MAVKNIYFFNKIAHKYTIQNQLSNQKIEKKIKCSANIRQHEKSIKAKA